MKSLTAIGVGSTTMGAITNDQWLIIIGILITVLNMVMEYLKSRKDDKEEPE